MKFFFVLFFVLLALQSNHSSADAGSNFKIYEHDKNGKLIQKKSHGRAKKAKKGKASSKAITTQIYIGETKDITINATYASIGTFYYSFSGDPEYTVVANTCTGTPPCSITVRYTPTSENLSFATVVGTYTPCPTCDPQVTVHDFEGQGVKFKPSPECGSLSKSSIIKNDNRTLGEEVPIQGTEFSLNYTTEFTTDYFTPFDNAARISHFNPEGWSVSAVHYYDAVEENLFLGTGFLRKRKSILTSTGTNLVVEGNEVFEFDANGKHLSTKSVLTGFTKYSFTYSLADKLIKITDAYGRETDFTRDMLGNLTTITSPYGQDTTITLNIDGLIEEITNENNETFEAHYYSGSELLENFTKPNGHETSFDYTDTNHLEYAGSNAGNFWEFFFWHDGTDPITERFSAEDLLTTYTVAWDISGNFTRKETSPAGFVKNYSENVDRSTTVSDSFESSTTSTTDDERFGNALRRTSVVAETINSLVRTTTFTQSTSLSDPTDPFSYSQIVSVTDVNGVDTTETFVKSTKTSTVEDPMGVETVTQFNSKEKPISIQLGSDTATTLSYDSHGRISSTTQNGVNTFTYTYNGDGLLSTVTNDLSETTSYAYDDAGRLETVTLPDTRVIGYEYNSDGQLKKITPPGKPSHNFLYNAFELISSYLPPALSLPNANTTYTYNNDKKIESMFRPDGTEISFDYNSDSGLLEFMGYGENTWQEYIYYPNTEKPRYIISPDLIQSEFTYFGHDQIASEKQTSGTMNSKVTFGFDNFFRVTSRETEIDSTIVSDIDMVYRNDNQLSEIGEMTLGYDVTSGRLTETTLDKIKDLRTYDTYGNLETYTAKYHPVGLPAVTLYSYTLTRDDIHRIIEKVETIQGVTTTYEYDYDSAGRLTTVTKNSAAESSYTYDSNSNRTSGTMNGTSFTSTFDDQDRMLTFNSFDYEYSDNGDLIEVSDGTSTLAITWDEMSRMKSATINGSTIVEYKLDSDGRRALRSLNSTLVNRAVYDGPHSLSVELNPSTSVLKEYVTATNVNSADYVKVGTDYFRIIKDHLGSPRLVVKASDGTVSQRMDYNEWGKVISDTSPGFQPFGFAGGLYDSETKLVQFGSRYYDSTVGRWLSKDPILFDGGDSNLYGYVLQDPINYVDTNGNFAIFVVPALLPVLTNTALWGGLIVSGGVLMDQLVNAYSKGGKQNIEPTDLKKLSDEEIIKGARDKSLPPEERLRYKKAEKSRGLRHNSQKKQNRC